MKMKKYLPQILATICLVALFFLSHCQFSSEVRILREGILDLRSIDFTTSSYIPLESEFLYFPSILVSSPNSQKHSHLQYKGWRIFQNSFSQKNNFTATLETKIPNNKSQPPLYFFIHNIYGAYEIYWNENLLVENGKISLFSEKYQPNLQTRLIPISNSKENNHLSILISNYSFCTSGITGEIGIGTLQSIKTFVIKKIISDLFFIICFSAIFIYSVTQTSTFGFKGLLVFSLLSAIIIFFQNISIYIDNSSTEFWSYFFPIRVVLKLILFGSGIYLGYTFYNYKNTLENRVFLTIFALHSVFSFLLYDNVFIPYIKNSYHFITLVFSITTIYKFNEWSQNSFYKLKSYSDDYKKELEKVKEDLKNYKKTFEQKILDKSYHLVTYMERLEIQTEEMEKLNELIVNLLEGSNIDSVLDGIFQHILTYYRADIAFLYFIDHANQEFYPHRGMTKNIPAEIKEFMLKSRMPISKEAGFAYISYKRKKTIYLENTKTKYVKKLDKNYEIQLPELLSQIYIPIIIRGEFQGIFFLASFNKSMNLDKDKLKYVSMFSNQLAIALQKENIMKEMEAAKVRAEEETQKANLAWKEAEEAKEEVDAINSLAKSINENLETKIIITKIMSFVEARYGIKFFSLYTLTEKKDKLKLLEARFPDTVSKDSIKIISKIKIPLENTTGAFSMLYKTGKTIYFKKLNPDNFSQDERDVLTDLKIYSMIGIPLKLKRETIGILSFFFPDSIELSKKDLKTIVNLGELVAGTIYNSNLHNLVNEEKDKSEKLLLSILPPKIAKELKQTGKVAPEIYNSTSILFTDFVGFTGIAEELRPEQLLIELDGFFTYFDFICEKYKMEKLKTIGDSYMCAGGIPNQNFTHPIDSCLTALEFRDFVNRMQELAISSNGKMIQWKLRIGIHTGPVIGGIVGTTKFTYDVWGDTVNTASRIESSGSPDKINISGETYQLVKDFFVCEYRGKINAKNKGVMDMYYLNRLKPELSTDEDGLIPNDKFNEIYEKVRSGELSLLKQHTAL
jgi:class 3 adenylate cyclase